MEVVKVHCVLYLLYCTYKPQPHSFLWACHTLSNPGTCRKSVQSLLCFFFVFFQYFLILILLWLCRCLQSWENAQSLILKICYLFADENCVVKNIFLLFEIIPMYVFPVHVRGFV